jgi:hypothetical protein
VNDDTHPIGGSAWEPAPAPVPGADLQPPARSGVAASEATAYESAYESAAAASEPVSRGERWRSRLTGNPHRRRGALAGGLGGLALGHATADEDTGFTERGQVGSPFGHDDEADHHGFPGGTPPQGSQGYVPGQPPSGLGDDGSGDTGGDDGSGTQSVPTQPGSRT